MPSHRFSLAVFLLAITAIVPLLLTGQAPAPDDPIAVRQGETAKARLARNVAGLYYDDAFYYLRIAEHLAAGSGSTFDGRHPTNGYHPLWLLCLVPLAWWLPDPESLLLASFVLQALLAALTTTLVYRIARFAVGRPAALMAALVWIRIQCTYWMAWAGMEYGLQALAIVGLQFAYLQQCRQATLATPGRCLLLGLLGSFAFLARLDNLLLAAFIGLNLVWRRSRQGSSTLAPWRCRVAYVAPIAIVVIVYVAVNLWLFRHPLPISGALKNVWSAQLLAEDPNLSRYGWIGAKTIYMLSPLWLLSRSLAASLLLGAFGGIALVAMTKRSPWRIDWWPLAAFSLLQYLAYAAVYHGGFSFKPWYFVAQPLLAALIVAAVFERALGWLDRTPVWSRWKPWGIALALAIVGLSTAVNTGRRQERQSRYSDEPLYVAAGWLHRNLPAGTTVGAWNAGILSYFSRLEVVNLDGLVNSRAFFLEGRHDLCAYFDEEGIAYLVDVLDEANPFAQYAAQIGHCESRLEKIWSGPGYPSSPRRAMAFRWLEAMERGE